MTHEVILQRAFLARVPHYVPALRLFRRNIGRVQVDGRVFKNGIVGQADLHGYLLGSPAVPVEIELKSERGKLSEAQLVWQRFCARWGVPWMVLSARADENAEETVERWCKEIQLWASSVQSSPPSP